jgi:hypothetical protein
MTTQSSNPPWWTRALNRVQSATAHPPETLTITHDDQRLTSQTSYADGSVVRMELAWAEVDEAIAFKRDSFGVDLICIAFGNEKNSVEINEKMPEWDNIIKGLPRYLHGCMSEESWFKQVAFPAFETNSMHIFRRQQIVP